MPYTDTILQSWFYAHGKKLLLFFFCRNFYKMQILFPTEACYLNAFPSLVYNFSDPWTK